MPLYGNTDNLSSLPKFLDVGRLLGISVTSGGSGYTNGAAAVVTITGGGGTGATATANVVGGAVQSVTITNPGTGYTSDPTLSIPGASNATFIIRREANQYNMNNIVLVDNTAALLATNRSIGVRGPGWYQITRKENSNGDIRVQAILLATMTGVTTVTGTHGETTTVAEVDQVISISVQPANQTTVTGGATFSVTAAVTGGATLTYQWQKAAAATPTVFADMAGKTTASLALTGQVAGNTGDKYRVIISAGGAKPLTSSSATLTFGT